MPAKKIDFDTPPTLAAVLQVLEGLGTEQTRKTWRRHEVTGPSFGVLFGDLEQVLKGLKRTRAPLYALALDLWATGNHDARTLACKLAQPQELTEEIVESWQLACNDYGLTDAVASLVAQAPGAAERARRWADDPREYRGRAGWRLVAHLALAEGGGGADDTQFGDWLTEVDEVLSTAPELVPNRKRQAMYDALIAIGGARDALRPRALEAAERIGALYIDHGDTGCKTPDAGPYIVKTMLHRAAKAARSAKATGSGKT
jgi:3-methyladenine DNA glycosylase AlkD